MGGYAKKLWHQKQATVGTPRNAFGLKVLQKHVDLGDAFQWAAGENAEGIMLSELRKLHGPTLAEHIEADGEGRFFREGGGRTGKIRSSGVLLFPARGSGVKHDESRSKPKGKQVGMSRTEASRGVAGESRTENQRLYHLSDPWSIPLKDKPNIRVNTCLRKGAVIFLLLGFGLGSVGEAFEKRSKDPGQPSTTQSRVT